MAEISSIWDFSVNSKLLGYSIFFKLKKKGGGIVISFLKQKPKWPRLSVVLVN